MTNTRSSAPAAARRVDDERASHLAKRHRRPDRRRPVVIGPGPAAAELNLPRLPRRHGQRRAGRAVARAETRARAAARRARCESMRRSVVPSVTRINGAGTVSDWDVSPSASIVSEGPAGPSGCHDPMPARSDRLRVLSASVPAGFRLSLGTTVVVRVSERAVPDPRIRARADVATN